MEIKTRKALEAVVPCLMDWICTTGWGEVNRRDKAALELVNRALMEEEITDETDNTSRTKNDSRRIA